VQKRPFAGTSDDGHQYNLPLVGVIFPALLIDNEFFAGMGYYCLAVARVCRAFCSPISTKASLSWAILLCRNSLCLTQHRINQIEPVATSIASIILRPTLQWNESNMLM
jgi:hypothetical protein